MVRATASTRPALARVPLAEARPMRKPSTLASTTTATTSDTGYGGARAASSASHSWHARLSETGPSV